MRVQLLNTQGLTLTQLHRELKNGARFKVFPYRIGLLAVGLYRLSPAVLVRNEREERKYSRKYIWRSLLLGIWYFPYGPFDCAREIRRCRQGGLDVTTDVLVGLDERSLHNKVVDIRKTTLQFKHLPDAELRPITRALDELLLKYPEINRLYIATYINTRESEDPYFMLGFNPIEDSEIFRYEARKALYNVMNRKYADETRFMHLEDNEVSYYLLMQGDRLLDCSGITPEMPSESSSPAGLQAGSSRH